MRIHSVRIRNFRSIEDLTLTFGPVTAVCGPNSVGKSNVLRAIEFAFERAISKGDIYERLSRAKRDLPGAPRLSIYVDVTLCDLSPDVRTLAGNPVDDETVLKFRAMRNGTVTRRLGDQDLPDIDELRQHLAVVYVPPIRDLASGGLDPFHSLFSSVLRRARGEASLRPAEERAKRVLQQKADTLLGGQTRVTEGILGADSLGVDTDLVSLDGLYEAVQLTVRQGDITRPLSELGTGHQSAVIVNLYRQWADQIPGDTVFLLEEPDNHLHPSTVRAIAQILLDSGPSTQVMVTTHSPVFLAALGLSRARPIRTGAQGYTEPCPINLDGRDEAEIRRTLNQFNIRATEPLVSAGVVLCEGPLDAAVITALAECERGRTADEMGISIVPVGGKSSLVTLATFLTDLGASWTAVVDWDAAFASEQSRIRDGIPPAESLAALAAIPALEAVLDASRRRGNQVHLALQCVADELQNGRAEPVLYDGSPLESLARLKGISADVQRQLRSALRQRRLSEFRGILGGRGLWIWAGELEDAILTRAISDTHLEQALIAQGVLPAPVPHGQRRQRLAKVFKGLSHRPSVVAAVISHMRAQGCFNRTEVNQAMRTILNFSQGSSS